MSLHKFAEQVASQGRGDDSLLVHMTPDEVRKLQQFAQANGRSLTINPTTGLPEAGMLSDLFKSIAPIVLGAFLGPAGFGMSSMMAGLTTGGITALATGSLSRGLMAGLGAYGGAGLGANLMGAGTASIGSAAEGIQGPIGSSESGFSASQAISAAPKADVLSAGFKAAAADPMGFAKNNLTNIGMAAAPIMAMQPTTKMPEPKDTGYIRQMAYNRNPDTGRPDPLYGMREMTPVKASEWGDKTFQGQRDLFYQQNQNQNPYQLGVGSLNQPPLQQPARMNTGGIVALAGGGVSDADVANWFAANPGATDADISSAMSTYGVDLDQIARATGTQDRMDEYTQRLSAVASPEPVATPAPFTYTPEPELVSAPEPEPVYTPAPAAPAAPVAPTRSVIEPEETVTAPTGIETLTAAMPPIAPVAPAAPAKPTDAEIVKFFTDNPTVSDEVVATIMNDTGLKPEDIARATGSNVADVQSRYDAVTPTTPVVPETAVAPTGIETLTAAMPPVVPKTPVVPEVTDEQIQTWWSDPAHQKLSDVEIKKVMDDNGVTPTQFATAIGANETTAADIATRYEKAAEPTGIETLTAAIPPVAPPTEKPTGIETLTAPVAPPTAPVAPKYNQYTNEQIAQYLKDNPTADLTKAIKDTNADPAAVNKYIASLTAPFKGSTDTAGGSGTLGIYNQMKAQGIDPNELYKAATANDPKYAGYTQQMIEKAYNLDKGAYALSDKLGGKVADTDWVKFMDDNKYSIDDAAQAFGLSRNEVKSRYDAVKAAEVKPPVVTPPLPDPFTSVVPGGIQLPGATTYDNGAFGNYGSGNKTGVDSNGKVVSIATPGDIITNPDQTRTVTPNIPGRPYGGFPGMDAVKSAYTAGGGSLGYTAPIPKDPQATFNKMTDDSLDAYNFLMGKGKNLTQRKAETKDRPVMQRYDEAVLGRKIAKPVKTTATTKSVVGVPGKPQSYFNEAEYLAANPDVAAELKTGKSVSGQPTRYTSGYEHYLMYGKSGGRAFTGDYEGYLTAAALTNAANAGGGDGNTTSASNNTGNTISGFNPAAPNPSIAESFGNAPASTDGNTGSTTGTGPTASAKGGLLPRSYAMGGGLGSLGSYSDGGRLLKGPGDGVSDSIPATIGQKQQPARLADGEFVVPARIVSELGNGSTDAGAKKLYAMLDRVQRARGKTTGRNKVAANSRSDKYLPA